MTEIRISSVDIFKASIPMIAPFRISLGVITEAEYLFVRINTDAGVSGWGEATPLSRITGDTQAINAAAAVDLAQARRRGDPLDIEGRVTEMGRFLAFNTSVRSAFDMALYDVAAQVARLPLYAFLGGGKRQLETDVTIGIDDAGRDGRQGRRAQAERSFGAQGEVGDDSRGGCAADPLDSRGGRR